MYLKACPGYKGKIYLSFVEGYRDENGKSKQRTVKKIGYLDELKKQYDDPINYFKEEAKKINNQSIKEFTIKNIDTKKIDKFSARKNLGYFALKNIYNDINFESFFKEKQKKLKMNYNLDSIMRLLIYSRILYPSSKKETYSNKDVFFEDFDFSLKDLYRSLDYFNEFKEDIQTLIWNNTKDVYNRDVSTSYYDCTNYYFEISYNDEDLIDEEGNILEKGYRKKGPSKEHRPEPIIGMGLLMDKTGIPLSYDLFPGNESEKTTLRPIVKRTKSKYGIERTIVVADRGLNTSDNTFFLAGKNNDEQTNHDGYVYGQSIKGADKEFQKWALEQSDFIIDKIKEDDEIIYFKHKSRVFGKKVQIQKNGKRSNQTIIYQKQMVYYSQKYADKQKKDRELVIEKAKDLIKNPSKYTRATSVGAAGYIDNIDYDKETGIVIEKELKLNLDKIKEEEKFDGYYSIVTSEKDLSDKEIRDIYKGLWKIEESFKITKSQFKTRPVYVWTKEHIEAHFLTCFISLVIIRLLELKLNRKFSTESITNSLKKYSCSKIEHDYYLFDYYDDIIEELEKLFSIDLSSKYQNLKNIRKILK